MNNMIYAAAVERLFKQLQKQFDDLAVRAPDLDVDIQPGGVLNISFDNGSEIVINRHDASEEVWLAAQAGGFHFSYVDGRWLDRRSALDFADRLTACILEQGEVKVDLHFD